MWSKMVSAGLEANQTVEEQKKLRMLNQLAIIFGVVTLPYPALFYLLDLSVLCFVTIPVVLTYLVVPAINRLGFTLLGRLVFLLNSNAVVFSYSVLLGVESGMYLAFFSTSCCPMLFHDRSSRASTLLLTLLPAALCILILAQPAFLVETRLDVSAYGLTIFRMALAVSVFLILWAILGVFMSQSNLAIQHLIQARRDREGREKAEQSLLESQSRLARVVEASGLVSWSWDLESNEITLGGAWRSVQQTSSCKEVMPVQDWFDRVHPEDRDAVREVLQGHARGEQRGAIDDYRVFADDDNWRWLRTDSSLLETDEAGTPISLSGTHRDVHDRHTLEAQARQLAMHTTMIQEVHHRVKNNLQIVSSLISFQQVRAEDQHVARQFEVTRNRVAAIASLHETLYSSADHHSVELGFLLHSLARDVRQAHGITSSQLVLTRLDDQVLIPFEQAGPCALLVNEWVTNSIKHAFDDDPVGEIQIGYSSDGHGTIEVCVRDDGKGSDPTGARRPDSIGLKLVDRLATQLNGTVAQVPSDRGTHWCLRFEVS